MRPRGCTLGTKPVSAIGCLTTLLLSLRRGQGCSSPIVVKFADTQKDKEQKRMAQQLQQQMQQLNAASMWGNLTGLNSLGPQYLAVSTHTLSHAHIYTRVHACQVAGG